MAEFLRRVTIVDRAGAGEDGSAFTLLKSKNKKKKTSKLLRPTEKILRQYLKAERRCWTEALDRHDKARRKKKDRWLRDGLSNSLKSVDKGLRTLSKI